ncbi:hypothetical protein ATCC90586_001549 [Pythium insidiosum]|nr:hypothetical protein ATCC90586_001549 [Pythium insidiosum]
MAYFRALGGFKVAGVYLVVLVTWQCFQVSSDFWLSHWTGSGENGNPETKEEVRYNVSVYALLGLGLSLMVLIRALILAYVGVAASQYLFSEMTKSLLNAPLRFFDANPIGRIINRYAEDISTVDFRLPFNFFGMIVSTTINIFQIFTAMYVIKQVGVLIIPLAWVYFQVAMYFLSTSREISRLFKVTTSPVLSHVAQSEEGVAVLRAFGPTYVQRATEECFRLVDTNSRAWFAENVVNQWFAIRVQMVGFGVIVLVVSTLIVFRHVLSPGLVGAIMVTEVQAWSLLEKHCDVFRGVLYFDVANDLLHVGSHGRATLRIPATVTTEMVVATKLGCRLRLAVDLVNALSSCRGCDPERHSAFWRRVVAKLWVDATYPQTFAIPGHAMMPFDATTFSSFQVEIDSAESEQGRDVATIISQVWRQFVMIEAYEDVAAIRAAVLKSLLASAGVAEETVREYGRPAEWHKTGTRVTLNAGTALYAKPFVHGVSGVDVVAVVDSSIGLPLVISMDSTGWLGVVMPGSGLCWATSRTAQRHHTEPPLPSRSGIHSLCLLHAGPGAFQVLTTMLDPSAITSLSLSLRFPSDLLPCVLSSCPQLTHLGLQDDASAVTPLLQAYEAGTCSVRSLVLTTDRIRPAAETRPLFRALSDQSTRVSQILRGLWLDNVAADESVVRSIQQLLRCNSTLSRLHVSVNASVGSQPFGAALVDLEPFGDTLLVDPQAIATRLAFLSVLHRPETEFARGRAFDALVCSRILAFAAPFVFRRISWANEWRRMSLSSFRNALMGATASQWIEDATADRAVD